MKFFGYLAAGLCFTATFVRGDVVTNISELVRLTHDRHKPGVEFRIEGLVTYAPSREQPIFAIRDESGAIALRGRPFWTNGTLRAGDFVRASGTTVTIVSYGPGKEVSANCYDVRVLSRLSPETPPRVTLAEVCDGRRDYSPVRVRGMVREFFRDEIDPDWLFLVLSDGRDSIYGSFVWTSVASNRYERLIGSEVEIQGLTLPKLSGCRRFLGWHLSLHGLDDIRVIRSFGGNPFDAPDIAALRTRRASEIAILGWHRASGRIIAFWETRYLLLRTASGEIVRVSLRDTSPIPKVGQTVDVSGLPETELFNINLVNAVWRPAKIEIPPESPPVRIRPEDLIASVNGAIRINPKLHGKLVRLEGTVSDASSPQGIEKRLYLSGGPTAVQIDASACSDILETAEPGSRIEVTGICRIETDGIYPDSAFPHVRRLTVQLRSSDDIRILARPPWWTPLRLTVALGVLLAILIAVLVWNALLRRISDRKGRALAKSLVSKTASEMKVRERTRLATELHDSIVQSLTGVAMELRAVRRLGEADADESERQFSLALKTLDACRGELRNCIWDLRSRALDDPTMDSALARSLLPHADGVRLAIRFAVARSRLTDNTTHALICVIRELVHNAIRHGRAKSIRVAGCLDGGRLLASVSDDGTGFDTQTAPGSESGHFGLQGIRERIASLHGTLGISSVIGKGTKATISFPLSDGERT